MRSTFHNLRFPGDRITECVFGNHHAGIIIPENVKILNGFYIYVSGLSTHTQNLNANPRTSVLFVEDEAQTSQIFARRRLNYDCTATLIERETDEWKKIVDRFQQRFGEVIEMLRGLADFRIFKLTPHSGRFVIGFGQAYHINGDNLDKLVQIGKQ